MAAAEALESADAASRARADAEAGFSADNIMRTMLDYDRVSERLNGMQTSLKVPPVWRSLATQLALAFGEAVAMMLSHLEEATLALNEANRFLEDPKAYAEEMGLVVLSDPKRATWESLRRVALGRGAKSTRDMTVADLRLLEERLRGAQKPRPGKGK